MFTQTDLQAHKDKLDRVETELMDTFKGVLEQAEQAEGPATVHMALLSISAQLFCAAACSLNEASHRFEATSTQPPEITAKVRQMTVDEIVETFGKIDALVNGIRQGKTTDQILQEIVIQGLMANMLVGPAVKE